MVQEIRDSRHITVVDCEAEPLIFDDGKEKPLHPGQLKAWQSKRRFVAIFAGWRSGKALDVNTPIPTPRGFVRMGELRSGMQVFGRDGKPCNILMAHVPYIAEKSYLVTFCDGSEIVADAAHLWYAQSWNQRKNERRRKLYNPSYTSRPQCRPSPDWSVTTTADMLAKGLVAPDGGAQWSMPLPAPINYDARKLPLDPYCLGAWLGDGHSRGARITSEDRDVISRIEGAGFPCVPIACQNAGKATTYRIGTKAHTSKGYMTNDFVSPLRVLGVMQNKHIPEVYKTASIEQRRELLRGLLDTDGYCSKNGEVEFCSIREQLATDVLEVVRSLGLKCRMAVNRAAIYGKDCGMRHRVFFYPNFPAFTIARKLERQRLPKNPMCFARYVRRIDEVAPTLVRCITVDSPDSLYLAGRDYVVTHNTVIGPWWLIREMQRKGPGDYAVLAPTYPLLDNKGRPELLRVLRKKLGSGSYSTSGNIVNITPKGQLALWGKVSDIEVRILMRHADRVEAIEAFDARGLWVDEPGQIEGDEVWDAIQARVSIGLYRILLTSRPFKLNWYIKEIWNRVMDKTAKRKADADPQIDVINFKSTDNPAFSKEEYKRQKARMIEWRFLMKYDGIPTKAAGIIYDDYLTVVREPVHFTWQRSAGHDFGKLNTGGLWAFKHPTRKSTEGRPQWVIYSSYLNGNRTASEHIDSFLYGEDPMHPFADKKERSPETWRVARKQNAEGEWEPIPPWAWGGNATTEDDSRELWSINGYPIAKPPIPRVMEQIDIAYAMLKTREIVLCEDLSFLIGELDAISNEVDDEGYVDQEKIVSESKYHRAACLRYLAVGLSRSAEYIEANGQDETIDPDEARRYGIRRDETLEGDLQRLRDKGREGPSRMDAEGSSRGRANLAPKTRATTR